MGCGQVCRILVETYGKTQLILKGETIRTRSMSLESHIKYK